jgi:stage II sporulation protein E
VQVSVFSNRPREENGDRCLWFAGTEGRYYVLMCDGMGTGSGAVAEGTDAAGMLKGLLCAGFSPGRSLESINSLCALREQAGAVTVDLAEICLDSGRVTVYKWGAAASYLLSPLGVEKIGTAGPPPGLSATQNRLEENRLSLRRGELLVLASDGAGDTVALEGMTSQTDAGEIGRRLVSEAPAEQADDATVAVIRLLSP